MHERAATETERDGSKGGDDLRPLPSSHDFGHLSGEDNGDGLRDSGEETEADERSAKKFESEPREEGRHRRILHVAPGEVAGVFEGHEFVAVEAVAPAGSEVREDGGDGDDYDPRADVVLCVRGFHARG